MANKLKTLFERLFGEFSHFDSVEKNKKFQQSDTELNIEKTSLETKGRGVFTKNNFKNNHNPNMEQTEIPVEHAENIAEANLGNTAENVITDAQTAEIADASEAAADTQTAENAKMVEQETQITELKDKYLRLAAEFDNYKRRMSKERIELMDTAAKDTVVALLPILDDFDRAAKANETATEVSSVVEGFKLIHTRIFNILKQRGLKEMETANQSFDADFHEAIAELPMGDDLKGKVFDTTEKGYFLHDKIIRFAKVVVGK